MSAQTACSRELPVPKSGPATRTEPAAYAGSLRMKVSSLRQAAKRPSSKPDLVTRLRYSAGMIWSVSTLLRRSGTPVPVWVVKASMSGLLRGEIGDRRRERLKIGRAGEGPAHRGGGGDLGTDQVGA